MKNLLSMAVSCFFFFLFVSSPVLSSEVCSALGGACRDACGQNEAPEAGAFEDCTEKQQCCVSGSEQSLPQCCVFSFDAKKYGESNCGLPENNTCPKGSGNPVPCSKLTFCR